MSFKIFVVVLVNRVSERVVYIRGERERGRKREGGREGSLQKFYTIFWSFEKEKKCSLPSKLSMLFCFPPGNCKDIIPGCHRPDDRVDGL